MSVRASRAPGLLPTGPTVPLKDARRVLETVPKR
jgi:hypothetical protein